jgi:hypothetical protein
MKRLSFYISFLFFLSVDSFSECLVSSGTATTSTSFYSSSAWSDISGVFSTIALASATCNARNGSRITKSGYTAFGYWFYTGGVVLGSGAYVCKGTGYSGSVPKTCPDGQVLNTSTCICQPIEHCSWATNPPYFSSSRSESTCNNAVKGFDSSVNDENSYLFNFSFCSSDSTCYARRYYCPAGQTFDTTSVTCVTPIKPTPDNRYCTTGYYPTAIKEISSNGLSSCGQDWICKDNPNIVIHRTFSCGSGPVDDGYPETNPDAPVIEPDLPAKTNNLDRSFQCSSQKYVLQAQCSAPNVLKFSCNPITGISSSSCDAPINPDTKTIDSGDSTKGATTEDIKNLSNDLPEAIKKALSNYMTDGSMPHLEAIRGSLDAVVLLDSDRNDKLDSISASSDASLVLQSDLNGKVDTTNQKLDLIKDSLNNGKTSEPFVGFNDSPLIEKPSDNSSLFSEIGDFANQISGDASNIVTQLEDTKSQISNGFQPIVLPTGSCQDFSFSIPGSGVTTTIPMSRVPSVISPYSPIFSLLVYISIMFFIFRFLFLFFISRSKS